MGANPATIQWQLNNIAIQVDNNKYVKKSNGHLIVKNLVGSDEGVYSCSFQVGNSEPYTVNIACVYVLGKIDWVS